MYRRFSIVILFFLLVLVPVSSWADDAQIFQMLENLSNAPERFASPERAQATAREFFQQVQSLSGSDNPIEVLRRVKRSYGDEWNRARRAET